MRKTLLLLITIFYSLISLFLFQEKENNVKDEFKENFSFPFYKANLKDEYLKYQEETNLSLKQAIINVNIGLNRPFYTDTKEVKDKDSLTILVNKYNYLPEDYIPKDLVNINGLLINKEAYIAFKDLKKAIENDNMNIRIVSAYRSYNYQKKLYNNYLKTQARSIVDTYSARPGYSEHQTGLAIDVDNGKYNYNQFYLTKEFLWMEENSFKYGFILRYPKDKESITGYRYEPWHYRYVGKEIAEYIKKHNSTYEEYYYEFIDI